VFDGQKTWTTRGAFCTHLFGLFRTDPESERHRGLTYFMLPLVADGVTVRGFGRLDGDEGFAEVFFDNAFVPDDAIPGGLVIGEIGRGWSVAMATTGSERGLTLRSPGRFLASVDRLVELYHDRPQPASLDDVIDAWARAEAYQLFTLQTVTGMVAGTADPATSSINKIWWSELDLHLHDTALALLGADAELTGEWAKGRMFALSGPIYAGTNEIQRNLAAERLLGLPRR
jgi:alkylation response protein AidB-like acyl-CoA dehydrogenase